MGYRRQEEEGSTNCLQCGHELYGRTDKKFCNDSCRNRYYSSIRTQSRLCHRQVMNRLSSNYRILEELLKLGVTSIGLPDLVDMGFSPSHMTSHGRNEKGYDENHCFDIAYRQSYSKVFDLRIDKSK